MLKVIDDINIEPLRQIRQGGFGRPCALSFFALMAFNFGDDLTWDSKKTL
jgi:hypothetical protein